jgi:hypothetical protein
MESVEIGVSNNTVGITKSVEVGVSNNTVGYCSDCDEIGYAVEKQFITTFIA